MIILEGQVLSKLEAKKLARTQRRLRMLKPISKHFGKIATVLIALFGGLMGYLLPTSIFYPCLPLIFVTAMLLKLASNRAKLRFQQFYRGLEEENSGVQSNSRKLMDSL